MGIKNFEELYGALGQKINYTSKEVADLIDADAFRQVTTPRPRPRSMSMADLDTLLETSGQETVDDLVRIVNERIEYYIREAVKDMTLQDAKDFRLVVDGEDLDVEIHYNIYPPAQDETDPQVYTRVAHRLKLMAKQELRKASLEQTKEKKKFEQYKVFVETVSNMSVDSSAKAALIAQYKKDHGIK